ncbi:relaxase/mobilization nuclease domain-containing protein [Macrococcoides caseolyticum]|uniref:Truncated mobilization protein n=1 Tax=Macrococcus caseolyticus (strain JCSC5402) TaxID=458233 RepID=B9ECF1_MACCJ|nr:relaxase/mobilization nuclease domain-containing protein [Macrococcus caseolyticus]BAH18759.1 truncated mobilization protein [Macrococcus caseolyticus JCSC5402]
MAYTKVAPSKSSGASIVYARDGKDNGKDKCVAMSGLNCDPSNAEYEFAVVRRAHNKALKEGEDIQARLIIQSFEGEELSPEEVNEMGYELAENINEKLGGGFQAVVYTHGNTKNLHNHIVFNSVNADTGKKYTMHYEKFEIEKMNDEIVSQRGLNVIEKQKKDITTNGERKLRENGQYVWKDDLKDRFNRAFEKTLSNVSENKAENLEEFKKNLNELGVSVKERYVKKRDTTYFTLMFSTDENRQKTRLAN